MPNSISSLGLQTMTRAEIIDQILNGTDSVPGLYAIYGTDINVDPNSADGQLVNLIAQSAIDIEDLLTQIYNSFDPDQAVGVNLDLRCAINGVVRNPGAYTLVNVNVTFDRSTTLEGLDEVSAAEAFKVSDAAGNTYSLVASVSEPAGVFSLGFRADVYGPFTPSANTLTRVATPTLGVTGVTNPSGATTVGQLEESDYHLRIRRANSVSLPSQGYFQGLYGALLNVPSVTSVLLLENNTDTTDGYGIPSHSIWVVVAMTDLSQESNVAQAIYLKRNAGCGMKGGETFSILQADGTYFPIYFDLATPQDLHIQMTLTAVTGSADADYMAAQILALLSYQIGQQADASAIVTLAKSIEPNVSISGCQVSDDGATWVDLLSLSAVNNQWALDAARITVVVA